MLIKKFIVCSGINIIESFCHVKNNIDYKKETAGGLVFNNKNELLLIYRKKLWDLPKGKLDFQETHECAALREVVEETGVLGSKLKLIKPLISTNYYSLKKNKTITKTAKWFLMYYGNNDLTLTPDHDESISEAKWVPISELNAFLKSSRNYVSEVINCFLMLKLT
tara:strand:- start:232 stop:729 length:498 start_codon:yes stop_codon:yes gene_type:complete